MCSQICMLVESPVGECNSRPYEISELRISMDFMDVFILFWQDKDKSRGYFCKTSCEAGWCSQHLQPACKTSPWPPTPRSMRKFSKAEVRGRKAVPRPSWQKESAQTTSLMKRYSDATCGQIFEDKTQNLSKWLIWNCHLSVEYMILCKRYTYIPAILYTSQVSFYGASQLDLFSHVTLALLTGLLNAWFYARSGPPGHDMHDTYFVRSQFIFCMHGIPSRYPRS